MFFKPLGAKTAAHRQESHSTSQFPTTKVVSPSLTPEGRHRQAGAVSHRLSGLERTTGFGIPRQSTLWRRGR